MGPDEADERVTGAPSWRRRPAAAAAGAGRRGAPRLAGAARRSGSSGPGRPGSGVGARRRERAGRDPADVLRKWVGSRRGTAAIIPAPTLRPAVRPAPRPRRRLTGGGTLAGMADVPDAAAPILRAELLAIGTELTVGETHGHQQRRARAVARRPRRDGRSGSRTCPTTSAVVVDALRDALAPGGPRRDDRRARARRRTTSPARPSRRRAARPSTVDPATLDWLRGAVGAPPPAVPRRSTRKQAWLHPVGDDARRTRTARRPAGGSTGPTARVDRHAARPAARDAADVGGRGPAAAGGARRRRGHRGPDAAAARGSASRRSRSCWATRCCGRRNPIVATYARAGGGRRPDLARAADGRPRRPRARRRGRGRWSAAASASYVWARGDDDLGRRRSARRSRRAAGRWRRRSAAPTARSSQLLRGPCRPSCSRTPAASAADGDEPTRATTPATWPRRSASARRSGADVGCAIRARPRRRRHGRPRRDRDARRARTPSGGSRSCAGARARTGRRSPARRSCCAASAAD